ncbi:MAG: hypothetical protein WBL05_12510 [Brooklawnia sp.]|uniref:hypothetical protein n=1 Tax=Brooklawnia sp. TaxID=2699740 RepID=UPI003C7716B9
MRSAIFLVTAMSCMVIAAGFISRGNYLVGAVVGVVGVYYVARVFLGDRLAVPGRQRQQVDAPAHQPGRRGHAADAETAALRQELEGMLVELRKKMVTTRSFFIGTAGIAAIVFFANWQLALAIVPFAVFFAVLFFRNAKAVSLLERNL